MHPLKCSLSCFATVTTTLLSVFIADAQAGERDALPGQIIVQFKPDQDEEKINNSVARHGGRIKKRLRTAAMKARGDKGFLVIETDEVAQVVEKLKNDPAVEFAEPDWIQRHQTDAMGPVVDATAIANDTYYTAGYLWGLKDTGSNSFGSRASAAWAAGYTGTNSVYVGVIDEGMQWQHADLAPNIWNNPFDPPDGRDNDGNGYVDDVRGWDFYSGDSSVYDAGGDQHGTHVAGTIAAAGGDGRGVVGVNWKATVIAAKFLGVEGGYTSDAIAAIDYFVDLKQRHGLNIVALNNSWGGGGYSQALHNAVLRAAKAEILFVAAAGNGDANGIGLNNDNLASYPSNFDTTRGTSNESAANYNGVVAVAAIDSNGALGNFSNFGLRTVHLGAPGVGILSTVPGGYGYMDGTSMATPHVTGGIALYASTHPGSSAASIRQAILQSATPTATLAGKSTTGARLNLGQVVATGANSSGSGTQPSPAPAQFVGPSTKSGQFRMKLQGVAGNVYDIQTSSDLKTWTMLSTVTNATGVIDFSDPLTVSSSKKFYRAVSR